MKILEKNCEKLDFFILNVCLFICHRHLSLTNCILKIINSAKIIDKNSLSQYKSIRI